MSSTLKKCLRDSCHAVARESVPVVWRSFCAVELRIGLGHTRCHMLLDYSTGIEAYYVTTMQDGGRDVYKRQTVYHIKNNRAK